MNVAGEIAIDDASMLLATMRSKPKSAAKGLHIDGVTRAGNRPGSERQCVRLLACACEFDHGRGAGRRRGRGEMSHETGCAGRKCGTRALAFRRPTSPDRQPADNLSDCLLKDWNPLRT